VRCLRCRGKYRKLSQVVRELFLNCAQQRGCRLWDYVMECVEYADVLYGKQVVRSE
jgi:hypothetical protein